MPTVDSSQSMSDYHSPSVHSTYLAQIDEVNSSLISLRPLLIYHPVFGFSDSGFNVGGPSMPQPHFDEEHAGSASFGSMHHASDSFSEESAESAMPNPPERYRRGRTYSVPSEEVLHGYLQFSDEEAIRFNSICHRKFQYFQLTTSDFNFLMGYVTDVMDLNYLTALLEMSQDFDADLAYESLTGLAGASYNPRSTKGWKIQEPALRYIHRFLAYNFSGRNDTSSNLNKVELFFLWCMQLGIKVNLGFWFARTFEQVVRNNRPLILSPYITHLASHLFPLTFNANQFTYAFSMDPLDVQCLDSMGLLAGTPDAPFIVPPGITTPLDERVYRRRTSSQPTPEANPQPNVHDEMHKVQGRLNSIETNIAEILSYLRPSTSRRGRGRGRR
ncbi:hypothetical protein V6N13_038051 [Hibiscus sabdariffa]